jgi:hypothetical protein
MTALLTVATIALVLTTRLAVGQPSAGAPESLASRLQPGMQLVYASDGIESPPWTLDSVTRNVTLGTRTGCVRLRLRTSPTQAVPDTRQHCVEGNTMLNWDERSASAQPARPLGARALLEIIQANGGRARFETGDAVVERIKVTPSSIAGEAPTAIDVLPTVVTTMDSTGKIVRRLRERFSIALATATGGVFEVPDSTQSSGWRVVRQFELVAIRVP